MRALGYRFSLLNLVFKNALLKPYPLNLMKNFLGVTLASAWLLVCSDSQSAESKEQLVADMRNHTQKLRALISDKHWDQAQVEARTLRDDLQALAKKASDLPEAKQQKVKETAAQAVELAQAIERNAEKNNLETAQTNYRKLQPLVAAIEAAFGAEPDKGRTGRSAAGSAVEQLVVDIDNHNKKLGKVIAEKKFEQVLSEAEMLQNDVKSLVKKSDLKSDRKEENLKEHEQRVIDLTQAIQRHANKADQGEAKSAYDKMQASVKSILALGPNVVRYQERQLK